MSTTLEQRVKVLEERLEQLQSELQRLAAGRDWRSTIGMFTDNDGMKEIMEEGMKIREKDREQARRRYAMKDKTKAKS